MTRGFILAGCAMIVLLGCQTNDIGVLCGTEATAFSDEPVGGENPQVEVVHMERNATCETFQCLTHGGLPPYCTRPCVLLKPTGTACKADSECPKESFCIDGQCQDDDCPSGFWCRGVQKVGPLAEKKFCLRQTGCSDSFACEDINNITCTPHGCYNKCLKSSDANCTFDPLVCEPLTPLLAEVDCACSGAPASDLSSCIDADIQCATATTVWPKGALERLSICITNEK